MPSNAEIFLQLNEKVSKEKRRKKIWRTFFFIFLLMSFLSSLYIGYVESFEPLLGKPAALYQENEKLKIEQMEMNLSKQKLITQLDSVKKVNDLLLENSNYSLGVFFEVQIGAFKKLDLSPFEEELVQLQIDKSGDLFQYTLGKFRSFEKARLFLSEVKRIGISDAFIVAKINGERVDLKEAKKAEKENFSSISLLP